MRGTWQGEKYQKIAEQLHRSEGHVRDVASELWEIISDVLREEVNKSNFRSAIERWRFSIISSKFKALLNYGMMKLSSERQK